MAVEAALQRWCQVSPALGFYESAHLNVFRWLQGVDWLDCDDEEDQVDIGISYAPIKG